MKYGLIAEKVSHSFSAEIHNKLFGYEYELKSVSKDDFDAFMRHKDFSGINVTIPYKQQVIPYLDNIHEMAKEIGAVNTVVNRDGKLYGYNTDVMGMIALIKRNGIELKGKKVLVLGGGGTSKTAYYVAKQLNCDSVYRVSRTGKDNCITYENALNEHIDAEVIINTTPVGMYPEIGVSPIDIACFKNLCAVVDVVYNPLRTKLVCDAISRGIKAVGGLYMLVAQAAFAAELFIGKTVDVNRIEEIYRELYLSKENIVLIGMPGSGKTATCRNISKLTDKKLIDTDDYITETIGLEPCQIICNSGEPAFRKIESEVIKTISSLQGCVISTGGGAVLVKENVDLLKENGRIYFIDRPLEDIKATKKRPLTSNKENLLKRYNERYDIYCNSCNVRFVPVDGAELNARTVLEEFNENSCN